MTAPPPLPRLPVIRGTQIGLRDPALVDRLKADMRNGSYAYAENRGRIGGVRDPAGRYYVIEGHHRIVAALEIYHETGDPTAALELIRWGLWTDVVRPPTDARPLPFRDWWGRFRNWAGF
jgi:hypothetical protein